MAPLFFCAICHDSTRLTNDPNQNISALICGHAFHKSCIREWFRHKPTFKSCPQCRRSVSSEGIEVKFLAEDEPPLFKKNETKSRTDTQNIESLRRKKSMNLNTKIETPAEKHDRRRLSVAKLALGIKRRELNRCKAQKKRLTKYVELIVRLLNCSIENGEEAEASGVLMEEAARAFILSHDRSDMDMSTLRRMIEMKRESQFLDAQLTRAKVELTRLKNGQQ